MHDYVASIFRGLDKPDLDQALEYFHTVEVGADEVVIQEGERDPTVAVVDVGELAIVTGDTVLGRASVGELVGEIALFGSGLRSATVCSVAPTRLLVLDRAGYEALRAMDHPVATNLEEHALHALTDRLRAVGDRIAALARGEDEDRYTPAPGFFDRVASAFGSGGLVSPGRVDRVEVLRRSPLFAGVSDEWLARVAEHFYPVGARRGHFLCTEGASGEEMYILARGGVVVVVDTADDRVEKLATLGPGEAFGMCALLQPGQPRMASVIALERVAALAMDRVAFAGVVSRNDGVGAVLRIAMIRAMADQLAYANEQLALLDAERQRHERTAREVEAIMRAAAALETHGEYLGGDAARVGYLYE